MKPFVILIYIGLWFGCSDGKVEPPKESHTMLELATANVTNFEDYIHTLGLYAFRKNATGTFVYHSTLVGLDQTGIAALPNNTLGGGSKLFEFTLPVGMYQLYALGNVVGKVEKDWVVGVTTPEEIVVPYHLVDVDSICFLGTTSFVSEETTGVPLRITLHRLAGKLVCILYDVPVQMDSVGLILGNLSSGITLTGEATGEARSVRKSYSVRQIPGYRKDTIVAELIAPPSLNGGSPMELVFFAKNGESRTKEMPVQLLLPDRYIRLVARVDDTEGALLSFDVRLSLFIIDTWREQTLPDFGLNKPL